MTANTALDNPASGSKCFGNFPGFTVKQNGRVFVAGPIELRYGEHKGPHRGFGFKHIWSEHFPGMATELEALTAVVAFVQSIISVGAAVYYEGGTGKQEKRAVVCKRGALLVILEETLDAENNTLYSVVTAFKSNPKGVRVATL